MSYPFFDAPAAEMKELPVFKEYAWDFNNNCFIRDVNGKTIELQEDEALKVWIYKALNTERYKHAAHTWGYGIELEQFFGQVMSTEERESELRRYVTECLMVNPYIREIVSISVATEGDKVQLVVNLRSVYGEVTAIV